MTSQKLNTEPLERVTSAHIGTAASNKQQTVSRETGDNY